MNELCCNNPPSRGKPEPIREYIPGAVTRQDIPFPHPDEAAKAEKEIIEKPVVPAVGFEATAIPLCNDKPKLPLFGEWRCNYHIATVSSLTLDQASRLLHLDPLIKSTGELVYPQRPLNWWRYEKPSLLEVDISYPLSMAVRLRIPSFTRRTIHPVGCCGREKEEVTVSQDFTEGYYLWMISQEYKRIYKEWEKYGVWGHALTDLYFERVSILGNGLSEIGIGS